MSNDRTSDMADSDYVIEEHYVVQVDGEKHSEHAYFAEAIEAALLLRESSPNSKISVRGKPSKEELAA